MNNCEKSSDKKSSKKVRKMMKVQCRGGKLSQLLELLNKVKDKTPTRKINSNSGEQQVFWTCKQDHVSLFVCFSGSQLFPIIALYRTHQCVISMDLRCSYHSKLDWLRPVTSTVLGYLFCVLSERIQYKTIQYNTIHYNGGA